MSRTGYTFVFIIIHLIQLNFTTQHSLPLIYISNFVFVPPSSPYVELMVKSPFDDIDPEYGLHGYHLHIVLHNTVCKLVSASFPQLFCHKGNSFLYLQYTLHYIVKLLT